MAIAALIIWLATAFAGLYMLAVWLIESDVTGRGSAASRLPAVVIFGHLSLALGGVGLWIGYLVVDKTTLAWAALGCLIGIAGLGLTMFARWIPVYQGLDLASEVGPPIPPERNFPLAVVASHGLLAVSTFSLVLLTCLGVGGRLSLAGPAGGRRLAGGA
ncbi:MAG: hypothetical protein ACRDNF_22160 [Streptosporangiaceae bacterium]